MDNQIDEQEVIETPAEENDNSGESAENQEEENGEGQQEDIEEVKKTRDELIEKNKKLYARLKKLEEPEKKPSKKEAPASKMSDKDMIALMRADIPDEDIDEVKAFAEYRKIPISEAIKNKTMQSILSERQEERQTANAAQTKGARGASKVTGEVLLEKARRGEVSDKTEDIEKLVTARINSRKAN